MRILVWNINNLGGTKSKYNGSVSKDNYQAFLSDPKREKIEEGIFDYVKNTEPCIGFLQEFDCQYRDDGEDTAAQKLLDDMEAESMVPAFPLCTKEGKAGKTLPDKFYIPRERQQKNYYSITLGFAKDDLKDARKKTLGNGTYASINEVEIDSCVFIAVHMNKMPLWETLLKYASKLLKENKPVIIAGDFNAFLPDDMNYEEKPKTYAQKFAELLGMGFVDLTPMKVSTYCGERHIDHILISPALARMFPGVEDQINSHVGDPGDKVVINYENGDARLSLIVDRTVIKEGLSDHACLILDIPLPESGAKNPVPQDEEQRPQSIEEYEHEMIGEEEGEEEGRDYFQDEMNRAGYTDEDYGEVFDGDCWDVD